MALLLLFMFWSGTNPGSEAKVAPIAGELPDADFVFPSAEISDGHTWLRACSTERESQCHLWASRIQETAPGITGTFLFDAFQAFYDSDEPSTLDMSATTLVGLFAVGYLSE